MRNLNCTIADSRHFIKQHGTFFSTKALRALRLALKQYRAGLGQFWSGFKVQSFSYTWTMKSRIKTCLKKWLIIASKKDFIYFTLFGVASIPQITITNPFLDILLKFYYRFYYSIYIKAFQRRICIQMYIFIYLCKRKKSTTFASTCWILSALQQTAFNSLPFRSK